MAMDGLSSPQLNPLRERVIDTLARVSAQPDAAAVLKVSANLTDEIARNTRVLTAPALPAGDLYSGVLYDALDLSSLETAARRRANRWVAVQSALYGVLRLTDRVAPYRLSMGVNLPGLGPLGGFWRPALNEVMPDLARGVIVDCRSSTYAAAWTPAGALADRWVQVNVVGATHMAKHTRGLVSRHLCTVGSDAKTPQALHEVVSEAFAASLTPPARTGQPWRLTVQYE
ncbi:hypothetical protein AZH51_02405 [Branchiibius sp. NY16-3462-2]|nr:hypothetical protein AZH51_02405 [Branchiibius sp. NY16-3462-2]